MSDFFIPCRACQGKPGPKPGYIYVEVPNGATSSRAVVECTCHSHFTKQKLLSIDAIRANIWPQALDYDISAYCGTRSKENVIKLQKYATNFKQARYKSAMLYLYGPNGTQKTTLAQWIGGAVLQQGFSVQYILMQNLLSSIASGFEADEDRISRMEAFDVDLLIVDESFSKDKVTLYKSGYQLPFLDRFLREHFELKKKGIIFVSNKEPLEIESQGFSRSIQDFIVRNTTLLKTNLEFLDNYMAESSKFDIKGLFDE